MKVIADGKVIRELLPTMRQALMFAGNHGQCLNAGKLEIVSEDKAKKPPEKEKAGTAIGADGTGPADTSGVSGGADPQAETVKPDEADQKETLVVQPDAASGGGAGGGVGGGGKKTGKAGA